MYITVCVYPNVLASKMEHWYLNLDSLYGSKLKNLHSFSAYLVGREFLILKKFFDTKNSKA